MYNNNGAPIAGESNALLQWESSIGLNRVDPKTGGKTTLMLKNLLASQSQKDVLDLLAQEKFRPGYSFDFFYLPIDFRSRSNYGYCFINFVTMAEAKRFHALFHHTSLHASAPRKLCEVGLARVQGRKNNIEQFRNSPINAIPSAIAHYRPLIFDPRGNLQPFPEPDQPLPTLQLRESRRKYGNGAPGAATNTAGKGLGARTHSLHHPNFAGAVNSSPGGSPVCVSPEHELSTIPAGLCMQPVVPAGVHQTFPAMNGLAGFSTATIPGGGVGVNGTGGMCMSFQGPTTSTCAAAASSAAAILAATIGGPLAAGAVTTTGDRTATGGLFGLGMAPPPVGAATSTSPSFLSSSATAARATATGTPTGALAAAASSANATNNSGASTNTNTTDNSTAAAATIEDVLQHSTATNASTTNSAAGASSNGGGSAPPADFHISPHAANATKAIGGPDERAAQSAVPVQLELAPMQTMNNMSSGQHNFHHQKSVIGTPSTAASSPLIFDYTRTDPSMGTLPYFAPGGYVWNNPASYLNVHPSYHLYHHGGAAYTATAEQGFW